MRLLLGIALLPLSGALTWAAAKAMAAAALGSATAAPFAAGMGLALAAWLTAGFVAAEAPVARWAARAARWSHVLGHELTHALASWSTGGSVYSISVGAKEGHVDLSHSNAFVALAPYCFPFYAVAVMGGYRALLWLKPEAGGEALFLFLMGAALGGHLLFTWESLTAARQPDLDAAGGVLFSWSLIAIANAVMILLLLKSLFPDSVALLDRLRESGALVAECWLRVWRWCRPAVEAACRMARP